ncbi:type 1 fimbrial protein [Enterobacteriaceae bacterium H4N4]|uniref:Type 1 fimbrial protein n=1 Tax=Silvania confinis TaxID=2926470 RepID=A0A9J6QG95_9ENTR|nr:fimbrial protein [Silvania confinis]MCU6670976.1 type 1 fimbrial protein [Silvania confinis]
MRLSLYLLLLIGGLFSPGVWAAACNGDTGQMTINFPNFKYLPSLPNNTQLTSIMADSGSGFRFTCDREAQQAGALEVRYEQTLTGKETNINGRMVFESAIPGIGYALGFQCAGGPIHYLDGTGVHQATVCSSSENPSLLKQQNMVVKAYITFYKTGDVNLSGGNHTNAPPQGGVGKLYVVIPGAASAGSPVSVDLTALNVDFGAVGSCNVTIPRIFVDLGKVSRTEFRGPGSTAGTAQTFTIPVYCAQAVNLKIGFFGTPVTTGVSDTLAISRASSAASGVGVKLSYGNNGSGAPALGTAVHLNEAGNLPSLGRVTANSASTAQPFHFIAQMVQTDSAVTAGGVIATATFALEYN